MKRKHNNDVHNINSCTKRRKIIIESEPESEPESELDSIINPETCHSASSVHNYILNDPILDIFKYYYSCNEHMIQEQEYKSEYSVLSEFFNTGHLFESRIIQTIGYDYDIDLTPVCIKKADNESKWYHDKTIELLSQDVEVIYQGALMTRQSCKDQEIFYGSPDLIIKVSCLKKFIKNIDIPSEFDDYYTIVDIKYTSIVLKADNKTIMNIGRMKANQCQVAIYLGLLKSVADYINNKNSQNSQNTDIKVLDSAFILGRSCAGSGSAFEQLGSVDIIESNKYLSDAHKWLTYAKNLVKTEKSKVDSVDVIDICIHNKIRPNMCNKYDAPYSYLKSKIAGLTHEITSLYNISYKTRNILVEHGVEKWSDPRFLDILNTYAPNKYHKSWLLKNMLEANNKHNEDNEDNEDNKTDIIMNKDKLESFRKKYSGTKNYFLDFETTSGIWNKKLESDLLFDTLLDSKKDVFLIGLMNHNEDYTPFLLRTGTDNREIYKDMYKNITQNNYEDIKNIKIFHWGNIEKYYIESMFPELDTNCLCDLYKEFIDIEIGIRSCLKYGLKSVFNSLLHTDYIAQDNKNKISNISISGLGASIMADRYYQGSSTDFKTMLAIIEYNKLDCLMLVKIFNFLMT